MSVLHKMNWLLSNGCTTEDIQGAFERKMYFENKNRYHQVIRISFATKSNYKMIQIKSQLERRKNSRNLSMKIITSFLFRCSKWFNSYNIENYFRNAIFAANSSLRSIETLLVRKIIQFSLCRINIAKSLITGGP